MINELKLKSLLDAFQCIETEENNSKIDNIFKQLQKELKNWSETNKLQIEPKLFIIGSYKLKCHSKGSGDLDLCCVGPETISDFFESFLNFILKNLEIKESRIIKDALFPVLKLKINNLSIDLQYAGMNEKEIPDKLLNLKKIKSKSSINCINGIRDMEYIESIIPNYDSFIILIHSIKIWAKRRGIYSNSFGYIGGISWIILVVIICLENPNEKIPDILFMKFFEKYSNINSFDTKKPLGLNSESTKPTKSNFRMLIMTPMEPYRNTARNVTKSTFKFMMKEFQRANDILKKEGIQKQIFKKSNFFQEYEEFIQIELFGSKSWNFYFESRVVRLLIELEKVNNLRVIPFVLPYKLKKSNLYFISIEFIDSKRSEFQFIYFDFINQLNEWSSKTDDDYLIINQLKR
eukprot:gene921-9830_t